MIGLERSKLNALTPVVKRRVVASISVRGGASLQSSLDLEHSCHNFLLNYAGGLTAGPFFGSGQVVKPCTRRFAAELVWQILYLCGGDIRPWPEPPVATPQSQVKYYEQIENH